MALQSLPSINKGSYNVVRQIGEGASKIVWLVYDSSSCSYKALALFRLPSDYCDEEELPEDEIEQQIEMVKDVARKEFEVLSRLAACNRVIHVEKIILDKKRYYFLMPFFANGCLFDFVQKQRLTLDRKLQIAIDLVRGLIECHVNSIFIGDIKPANVLIDESFHATITDFGTAQITDDEADFNLDTRNMFESVFSYLFSSSDGEIYDLIKEFVRNPSFCTTDKALQLFEAFLTKK
jgi:serine/threonine protein kinase